MGLVAVDVVTALTVGRGGEFVEDGAGLRYRPSGREPRDPAVLPERSAVHRQVRHRSRPQRRLQAADLHARGPGRAERPIERPQAAGRRTARAAAAAVRRDVRALLRAGGLPGVRLGRRRRSGARAARAAWAEDRFEDELARLAARFGSFDAEALFFGHQPNYRSSDDYEQFVYQTLADDLREAEVPDGASPVKSAAEVFRIFRDSMRSVVELGGLSLDSYLDFNADICSRIHRLVAGPPALRSRQMLALMDAGVVRMPYGPAPARGLCVDGPDTGAAATRISSTAFERPYVDDVEIVIRGHIDEPRIAGSASQLLTQLYKRGRVSQFRYGEVAVGSVDLTPDSHPIDIDGRPQLGISMFGVLTEGVRHFTAYIPSPRSRMRAFEDVGACVTELVADASVGERLAA